MSELDKLKEFRDRVIRFFKTNPSGEYYKVVKWIDDYTPVLDVTKRVKQVFPDIKEAYLTLYLKDPTTLSYEESTKPFPERSPEAIVNGWMCGYELERIGKDGNLYVLLRIPCKLDIKGLTLPKTAHLVGISDPKGFAVDLGDDYAYYKVAFGTLQEVPFQKIVLYIHKYDWGGGVRKVSNYNLKLRVIDKEFKIEPGKVYEIIGPFDQLVAVFGYSLAFGVDDKHMKKGVIELYSEYNYTLSSGRTQRRRKSYFKILGYAPIWRNITIREAPEYELYLKMLFNYKKGRSEIRDAQLPATFPQLYDFSKSSTVPNIGSEEFTMIETKKPSDKEKIIMKRMANWDYYYTISKDEYHGKEKYLHCGLYNKKTKLNLYNNDLRKFLADSYLNYWRKSNRLVEDGKGYVVIDVTDTYQKATGDNKYAYLKITNQVISLAAYPEKPPERPLQEIVYLWKKGFELPRMYHQKTGLWFYVGLKAKLDITTEKREHINNNINNNTNNNENNNNTNNINTDTTITTTTTTDLLKVIIPAAALGLGALSIIAIAKKKVI